jgi:C1A family cysteine protease
MRTVLRRGVLFIGFAAAAAANAQNAEDQVTPTFTEGANWVTRYLENGGSIKNITGLEMPLDWAKGATFIDLAVDPELPAAFDWREQTELQPIRNQGSCGSCWAFSVTAVTESLLKIFQPDNFVDLAEQTLVSSCSSAGSCSGGYFRAFDYIKNPGLPDETQDPYVARNTSCRRDMNPMAKISSWAYIGTSGRSPTTDQIKTAIMTYGPVSVTVNASFSGYEEGIYNRCNSGGVNHMVTLEGWNDEGGYWIMRNSWGENWGENGYMRIVYTSSSGRKCNNIGETAAFAILAEPTSN